MIKIYRVCSTLNKKYNRIEWFIPPIKGGDKNINDRLRNIKWVNRGGGSGELSALRVCKQLNN